MPVNHPAVFHKARQITQDFAIRRPPPTRSLAMGSRLHRAINDVHNGKAQTGHDCRRVFGHEADHRWSGEEISAMGVRRPGVGALYLSSTQAQALNEIIWYEFRDIAMAKAVISGNKPLSRAVREHFSRSGFDSTFEKKTLYEFRLDAGKTLIDFSEPADSVYLRDLGAALDADPVVAAVTRRGPWKGALEHMFHANDYSVSRAVGAALLTLAPNRPSGLFLPSARTTLAREKGEGNILLLPDAAEAFQPGASIGDLSPVRGRKIFRFEPRDGASLTSEELAAVLDGPKHFVLTFMVDPATGRTGRAVISDDAPELG